MGEALTQAAMQSFVISSMGAAQLSGSSSLRRKGRGIVPHSPLSLQFQGAFSFAKATVAGFGNLPATYSLQSMKNPSLSGYQINTRVTDINYKKSTEILLLDQKVSQQSVRSELAIKTLCGSPASVFFWNTLISRLVKNKQNRKAVDAFQKMQIEFVEPNLCTFLLVLKACTNLGAVQEGRCIHALILQRKLESEIILANCLINMYGKCGSIEDACKVFKYMPEHDLVTWSSMIGAFVKSGQENKALEIFQEMQMELFEPNSTIFVGVLKACCNMMDLQEGRRTHAQVVNCNLAMDMFVGSCLVDMYIKCGSIEDACNVFSGMVKRDVVTWSAMICGYAKCGQSEKALDLFKQMQLEKLQPNSITFVGVLNACASLEALEEGRKVHKHIIQSRCIPNAFVGGSLVDMYSKCGFIEDACRVFNSMLAHDVIAWNAMIIGYANCGQGENALKLYNKMQCQQVKPDKITFLSALSACTSIAALEEGRFVHAQILRSEYELGTLLGNCLIDMYCKCGSIDDACRVFNNLPNRDMVCWTSMLGGYAMHGLSTKALLLFEQICQKAVQMDSTTFVCILSACSHAGLVDEGHYFFESISSVYGISETREHYNCMVDLLGRVGCLADAENMVKVMPFQPSISVWMALLGACRIHGNIEIGKRVGQKVILLYPNNAVGYVMLSNIYAGTESKL